MFQLMPKTFQTSMSFINLELSLQINRLTVLSLESHLRRLKPPLPITETHNSIKF